MTHINITKEIGNESILSIENRMKIKKRLKVNSYLSLDEFTKVKWDLDLEFYLLDEYDRDSINDIYENIYIRIEKRKNRLEMNKDF